MRSSESVLVPDELAQEHAGQEHAGNGHPELGVREVGDVGLEQRLEVAGQRHRPYGLIDVAGGGNGADVLLTDLFTWMLGPRGPLVFMALVIGFALWLIIRDKRGGRVSVGTLAAMLAESVVLALLFGVVVGTATVHLVGPLRIACRGWRADSTAIRSPS